MEVVFYIFKMSTVYFVELVLVELATELKKWEPTPLAQTFLLQTQLLEISRADARNELDNRIFVG